MLDIAAELRKTLHLDTEKIPYITMQPGMETRIIHARLEDNFFVTQLRAAPNVVSGLHRHNFKRGGASGFTLRGRWGHDRQYIYGPGTYVFEPPGVIHQFFNGHEETEVVFFGDFSLEFIDPETLRQTADMSSRQFFDEYAKRCAEIGVKPDCLTA